MLLLKNVCYLSADWEFARGDILVDDGKITDIAVDINPLEGWEVINLDGYKAIPGLIDIHTHGAVGYDVMTASVNQFVELSRYLATTGTTAFLPATTTSEHESIKKALKTIREISHLEYEGALIEGVHIEGPYINVKQKGCHEACLIKPPCIEEYEEFRKTLGEDLKMHITVAPELDGALDFIKHAKSRGSSLSLGHSDANSDILREALKSGASCFTHLFNAMKGIHHREPGVAGTALVENAYVEIICDGVHVHPDIVKLVYMIKGSDSIVLVTDAMQAAGLGDGKYNFCGDEIKVINGVARKEDGSLAGSTLTLLEAVRNFSQFTGASFEATVKMACSNPARVIGTESITGSIETGKRADIVVLSRSMEIEMVFCRGRLVYKRNKV